MFGASGHLPEKPHLTQASCDRWGHPTRISALNQCQLHLWKISWILFPHLTLPWTIAFKITRKTWRILLWNVMVIKLGNGMGGGAYVRPLTLHEQFDNSWGLMSLFPLTLHIWVNFLQGKHSHIPSSQWSMCLANVGRQQWMGSSQWSPWLKHPLCFSQIRLQSEFTACKFSGWRT